MVRPDDIHTLVARALAEDIRTGDITTGSVIERRGRARATIYQKQPGVIFGFGVAKEVLRQCGAQDFDTLTVEGQWRDQVPATVIRAGGSARGLLAAERTALNFLAHLSGIATLTHRYVRAVDGSGVAILDTRKTTPNLRDLEKAAVKVGGGQNHRMGLHDAVLIKENHVAIAGDLSTTVRKARERQPSRQIEIECRDLDEVRAALDAGADRLLLDNMSADDLVAAVTVVERASEGGDRPSLEASGGITLDNVAEVAATGIDYISVGALTHSAPALDLSMEIEPA